MKTAMMWGGEFRSENGALKLIRPRRFLFETLPDLFPGGYLTDMEIALWARMADDAG